jgi:ABC-type multidrug transport system ATPase subunit
LIKYKNITLNYERRHLFDSFSVDIMPNEQVCFAGPSGRGKTTLLKMIPALVIPDSGEIIIDGMPMDSLNTKTIRRQITWIPQNINLSVDTAAELCTLLHLDDKKEIISTYINKLGLDDSYFDKLFADISGGEKQRVVIAVTLAKDKPIIVMDEPTSALDKKSIGLLSELIASLEGKTVVSASHNQQWLEQTGRVIEI